MTKEGARTKTGALEVLLALRDEVGATISDEVAQRLFTSELIADVFREAWRHPLEDTRSEFRSKLRRIVDDIIQGEKLKESSQ